jgi:2-polyprenyl-6-methoxyphenol hydroxylase-like FAD-dependent oxidoreductase
MRVRLDTAADPHACIIESTRHGWLFLLPINPQSASLIAVSTGTGVDAQLEQSRLIVHSIDTASLDGSRAGFSSSPRLHNPLCDNTHLLCGSAAMAFDPVCGEGVGHAVREAFLASAVVHAMQDGEPTSGLLTHYADRLRFGFLRHLELCRSFYSSGGMTEFWRSELELLEHGIAAMRSQLQTAGEPCYRLSGTRLIRI